VRTERILEKLAVTPYESNHPGGGNVEKNTSNIVLIVLAVIGAVAIIAVLGMWLMMAMMGGSGMMGSMGSPRGMMSTWIVGLFLLAAIVVAAVLFLRRRTRL